MTRPRRFGWAGAALCVAAGLVACEGVLTPPALVTPEPASTVVSVRPVTRTRTPAQIQLTPIPPTPTFTLSPTPTPVIHIVEQGDTLLGVALDYGVTLDALVTANLLNTSDYLHIGQSLFIPLPDESQDLQDGVPVGNMILPTPTPLPVGVTGLTLYRTPVGGVWCLGGIHNTTGASLTNIQVQLTLLTEGGTPVATTVVLAAADYLQPDQTAPFSALFTDPPDGVSDVQAVVLRAEPIGPITASFIPLTVLAADGAMSGPQYRVEGVLANESSSPVTRISVVALVFREDGGVLGYRQTVVDAQPELASGGQVPFDLLLTPQEQEVPFRFQLLAWGISE